MPYKRYEDRKTYNVWYQMLLRCTDPQQDSYPNYGGRGIKVCRRWKTFNNFLEDMGYSFPGYQLDRIDNNGDYTPDNCRWVTPKENSRNKRNNRLLTYKGETLTIAEWSERLRLDPSVIPARLDRYGLSVKESLNPRQLNCKMITFRGVTKSMSQWAEEKGIGQTTLSYRMRNGWPVERALTEPVGYGKRWLM